MKHLVWLFLLIPLVCYGADSKITDLPDVGASSDDVMYVVDNPGTSSASDRKITLGNLLLWIATQDVSWSGTWTGNIVGNASTATALAANPTDCAANQFATTIAANGNLTCAALTDADIPDTITASNYLPLAGGTMTGDVLMSTLKKIKMYESTNTYYVGFLASDSLSASYDLIPPASSPTGILRADAGVMSASDTLTGVTVGSFEASKALCSDGSGNATHCTSQNLDTTGQVKGLMPTVVYSADGALNVSQAQARANTFFVNTYAGTQVMTLPAAEAGMAVCIRNGQNNSRIIQVHSDGTDYLVVPSTGLRNTAANHFAATASPANQICLVAVDTTDWYITSTVGTWAEEE